MVNWDYLKDNVTKLEINTTELSDPYTLPKTIIETADTTSDGYLGLAIMLPIFLVLLFLIYRDDGDIRLDILRSIMISSGFTSIIGLILIISPIASSFTHVMWFISIFILSMIFTIWIKKQNL